MRFRTYLFLCIALLLLHCGQSAPKQPTVPIQTSQTKADSVAKQQLPSQSFPDFYGHFVRYMIAGKDSASHAFVHPKHGLWVIHANGALPEFTHYLKLGAIRIGNNQPLLPVSLAAMNCTLKEESLPVVNCDNKEFYAKTGCFAQEINTFSVDKVWRYAKLQATAVSAIETLATTISVTVINTANYKYYFSRINGSWYLTFIDLRRPCAG
jgi:hypothetical protein